MVPTNECRVEHLVVVPGPYSSFRSWIENFATESPWQCFKKETNVVAMNLSVESTKPATPRATVEPTSMPTMAWGVNRMNMPDTIDENEAPMLAFLEGNEMCSPAPSSFLKNKSFSASIRQRILG